MLCLKLDKGTTLQIGPDIFVKVLNKQSVTLGVEAPKDIAIKRVPDILKPPEEKK